jgi:Ser/Thr protein kinase RdoA (MazF antagonist)
MTSHDLSAADATARLEQIARRSLAAYDVSPDAALTLLNISENATYAVDDTLTGSRTVLRIHRHGYHDRDAIESELAWLDALRREAGVRTPRIIDTTAGERVLALAEPDASDPRHVVMFECLPGTEPPEDRLTESFELLGEITARMHRHALQWRRPTRFNRFAWHYDGAFGSEARWGRWQDGVGVGPAEREVLGRLDHTLRERLNRWGTGPHRYGLVHADLRLANLLLHGSDVYVIDFDDCGWSWFLYDFGAAVSFIEHDPRVPELTEAWLTGYRRVRQITADDAQEIPTFVMMRRLLLVAWIGSHAGTELARSMGAEYTATSCELAEDYLTRFAR